jgi:iron complex outermembrane receptor protein
MLSRLFRVLCFLLCANSLALCQAATSVGGVVKDPKNAFVAGATVTLVSRDNTVTARTISGGAGLYRFDHVLPGEYLLSATAPGFETSGVQIVEAGESPQLDADLHLRLAAVSTTITVSASGTAQTNDELAKDVSVVDAQTIDALDKSSIAEALSYLPGMRIDQQGGPGGMVSIKTRGLRTQDTAVLIDGFRLRDATAPQGDTTSLLQDLIVTDTDHIEVLRGTGSSIYGTNATGGVINIITGASGGRNRGSVLLEGGSMNTFRGRAEVAGSLLKNKLGYSAGIAHLNVVSGLDGALPDRNSSVQGKFDYALSNKTHVTGRLFIVDSFSRVGDSPVVVGNIPSTGVVNAVALSSSQLRLFEKGTSISHLNLGNATYISDYDDPDYNRATRTYSGALIVSAHPTDAIGVSASYQGLATHRESRNGPLGVGYSSDFPNGYQPYGGTEIYGYDGMIHTASARMDWRVGKYQSINAGYEFEKENYYGADHEPGASATSENVTQRNNALFLQDQLHLLGDRLQLAGSYRAQFFSLDSPSFVPVSGAPYSGLKFDAPPTSSTWDGSAAYLFRESGTKLRAHVGSGYRAPSLYERFGGGYYYGYSAYGDPELKPERSKAGDAGIDQSFWNRRALASATYFYTRINEAIDFKYSFDSTTDPYGRSMGYYNTNGGMARGVEASLSLTPARVINLQAAYTFTNARDARPWVTGVYQTAITPDHQFSFLVTGHLGSRATAIFGTVLASSYLAPISSHAFRFDGVRHGQVGANYRLPFNGTRAMRFFVNAENAFNQSYYESGYRTPGATVKSGIQLEF